MNDEHVKMLILEMVKDLLVEKQDVKLCEERHKEVAFVKKMMWAILAGQVTTLIAIVVAVAKVH
jgi:hypothetical protein